MKALVMSEEKRRELREKVRFLQIFDDTCAAMTEVEIPDGCALAVVEPVGDFKDGFVFRGEIRAKGRNGRLYLSSPVQEVKL